MDKIINGQSLLFHQILLIAERNNQFSENGQFVGIDLSSSSFNFHDCVPTTHSDPKWQSIHQIQKYIVTNKVLVKYGEAFTQLSNGSDIGNITQKQQSSCLNFGGMTKTMSQLSQSCQDDDDTHTVLDRQVSKQQEITVSDIIDLAKDTAYTCTSVSMRESLYRCILEFSHLNISQSNCDGSFLGSQKSTCKGIERRKRHRNDS